jgi:glycosyltransferase involved in cell wall biosynthesis
MTAEYPPYVWGGLGRYSDEAVRALRHVARVDVLNIPSYYRTIVVGDTPEVKSYREDKEGIVIHALLDESLDIFRAHPCNLLTAVDDAFSRLLGEAIPWLEPPYDFIYAQDYYTAPFAVRLHVTGIGRKLAVMCHLPVYAGFTYFEKPHSDEVHQALEATGVRLADVVIAPSEFAKRVLTATHAVHPDRITVIGEGVEINGARPRHVHSARRAATMRILTVARLVEQKGLHYSVDALCALREMDVPFIFSLIGRGPREGEVRALLQDTGLSNSVEQVPQLDHEATLAIYGKADIFLSTALYETFGLTILEAMSRGCVPVAFEIPALTELIGDAGITVPVGDTDAVAACIASLAEDPGQLAALARRCQRRAELFTWEAHARALATLMENVA